MVEDYDKELEELLDQINDLSFLDSAQAKNGGRKLIQDKKSGMKLSLQPEGGIVLASEITIKEIDELLKNSTMAIAQRVSQGTGNELIRN